MTWVIYAAHQHGTRVVLTISVSRGRPRRRTSRGAILGSSAARRNLARQAAAAVRDRGADGINLDFEPLASGYADEFVLFSSRPHGAQPGQDGLPAHLRHDRLHRQLPARGVGRRRRGRRDLRDGLRLPHRGSSTAGSIDPLSGPTYDLTDTVGAYTARCRPSRDHPRPAVVRPGLVDTSDAGRAPRPERHEVRPSATVNYENVVALVAQYGRRWDAGEQSPYIAYQRQNCTSTYGCVTSWRQLYYDDGRR